MAEGRAKHEIICVGIDLGSSYTRMGIFDDGVFQTIEHMGNRKIPSYVAFDPIDDSIHIGAAAKNLAATYPENTVFDFKSLIGRQFDEPVVQARIKFWPFSVKSVDNVPMIEIHHNGAKQDLSSEEILCIFLKKLNAVAEKFLDEKNISAVFAVPTTFNNLQRQIILNIGAKAGFNVLQIINEPTAAALTYGMTAELYFERSILMFHLGGGTLDLSIITMDNGSIEVMSSMGDCNLGSSDFDKCLTENLIAHIELETGENINADKLAIQRLLAASEVAKNELSSTNAAKIIIDDLVQDQQGNFMPIKTSITRDRFEELNAEKFERIKEMVDFVLMEADIKALEIDDLVFVGEATAIPKIHEIFQNLFDKKVLKISSEDAVVYGTAAQAAILSGDTSIQAVNVNDVTTSSFGIEVLDGLCNIVVEKNRIIPLKNEFELSLSSRNDIIVLHVYEGENHNVQKKNLMAKFTLTQKKNIYLTLPKVLKITILFCIDENGILSVSATERNCGDIFEVTKE